ncbi:DUF2849 domain-containing protein [Pararhodobacter sp.]|uniref:DUF2849 domain-containing protein n=1 Tax=Pararhodobacter sp. TaxID=2127056 RepID=UPI002AFFBE89|nr:DUF2849 domain-containing protein [Pararhodobacter sp.]
MSRAPQTHVVTANALIEGDVVYLTAAEGWTRDLKQAQAFDDKDEAEAALAKAAKRGNEVVGCYLAEVRLTAQGIEPTHFREDFRRRGPSNYAHGKQAAA